MQREFANSSVTLLLAATLAVGGCAGGMFASRPKAPPPATIAESHESLLIADYLRTLAKLGLVGNAEQAEIVEGARRAASLDPSTTNRLKLALILATPGHVASSPAEARSQLTDLLATPERLLQLERALATVMLAGVTSQATVDAENQRLRAEVSRHERERIASLTRRLQTLTDENDALRKSLDEASAKLDAIAALERHLSGERRPGGTGAKP